MKIYQDNRRCRNQFAVSSCWLKSPLSNGFHGLFLQPHTQTPQDSHVLSNTIGRYLDIESHGAFQLSFPCFLRVLWFNPEEFLNRKKGNLFRRLWEREFGWRWRCLT